MLEILLPLVLLIGVLSAGTVLVMGWAVDAPTAAARFEGWVLELGGGPDRMGC